jgi:hypothetical protein
VLPIIFFALTKLRGDYIPYGPFRLGRWGLPVNIFSIVYGILILIWLPFPPFMPVTALNMNYGGSVMGRCYSFRLSRLVRLGQEEILTCSCRKRWGL